MPITTFLHDNELNQPTGNDEIDGLLAEVRRITGRNYQVVTTREAARYGFLIFNKPCATRMSVYLEVGGVGPWQWLSCTHDVDTVRAYLLGMLGGCKKPYYSEPQEQEHENGSHEELINILAGRLGIVTRIESQTTSRYNEIFKRHVLKAAIRQLEKIGA